MNNVAVAVNFCGACTKKIDAQSRTEKRKNKDNKDLSSDDAKTRGERFPLRMVRLPLSALVRAVKKSAPRF